MSDGAEKSYHFNSNMRSNSGSKSTMSNNEDRYLRALEIQERKQAIIDEELERNRMILYEAGKNLGMKIAEKTVPNKNGFISVKPDSLPYGPTPDWVVNDAKEINSLVPTFVECHEKFIKLGRKKLYSK